MILWLLYGFCLLSASWSASTLMFCLFYVCLYTTQHGVLAPRDLAVSLTLTDVEAAIASSI